MNKRLFRLYERKKAIVKQSDEILANADGDERDLTDEETKTLEANEAEVKSIQARIDREEALTPHLTTTPQEGFDEPVEHDIKVKPSWEDDPCRGFKSTQEFFSSVMEATQRGETSDERLLSLRGRNTQFMATAGSDEAGTYSDPYGGFLVPTGFLPRLLTRGVDGDPTAGRTTQIPMATPRVEIPARTDHSHSSSVSGGLIVYRRSEAQSVTATRMQVEQVALTANILSGLTYTTEELLSDSAISFMALVEAGFRDEFAGKLLNEKIRGTGVGEMEGVLNTPALLSVDA